MNEVVNATSPQTKRDCAMNVLNSGGGKGGTGKSMVSQTAISWAIRKGMKVLVFDGDFENTDVLKPAQKRDNVAAHAVDLRTGDGWIFVANEIENTGADLVVISEPAGATEVTLKYEHLLRYVLNERAGTGTLAVVMNRQRDSVEILKRMLDGLDAAYALEDAARWRTVAIRNLYWGASGKFTRFNGSKQSERVDAVFDFPELHDSIADKLIDNRLLPDDANAKGENGKPIFTIAERSLLGRFVRESNAMFETMFGGA